MKVPPKRKGNADSTESYGSLKEPLNESPSEKEGKWGCLRLIAQYFLSLNESPSEKEGKRDTGGAALVARHSLNESPSEKEGKWQRRIGTGRARLPPQ